MKIEIYNLIKKFNFQTALEIDQLIINDCSALAILGPSGSGKSTLIRLIGGLSYPDRGTIAIDGQKINFTEKELLQHRKSIGVVFQSWNLFPHLTALENIILPLQYVHGQSKEEAIEISMDLLKRFELETHAGKKPFELSGGQTQRVALIRAVAIRPRLLILDEPTSALDPLMTAEVLDLILELKKEKMNLILVTHHLHFAKQIADRVIFISEGKVLEKGTSQEVFENPKSPQVKQYMAKVLAYRG